MLEPDLNRLFEVPEDFRNNLLESRHVKIFLSYFNPLHIEIYRELVTKGAEICLVLTQSVFNRIKKDYYEDLKFLMESKSTEIYLCDRNITLKNVVTERFCSLVLFDKKGKYDHQRLMSYDESALKWCDELFQYYKNMSTRLECL